MCCNFANVFKCQHLQFYNIMKDLSMIQRRNCRLRREIARSFAARHYKDLVATVDEVIRRPLKRGFYVEADSAIVIDRRRRAGKLVCKGSKRSQMWADFFSQVDALLARNPGMSRVGAICRVIASGTSNTGFCMSRELALKIYNHGN